jgi:Carbohydrate family 9 binding domain-like
MIRERGDFSTGPGTLPTERTWTKLSQSHMFPYSKGCATLMKVSRLILFLAVMLPSVFAADNKIALSTKATEDVALDTNPASVFWTQAAAIYADRDKNDQVLPGYRTEIRSRWTANNLYFLFSCPYEELFLRPNPSTATETNELWNWDVAEVFIGSDFKNIRRYREFEISPQGEWLDLDIDLTKPHHGEGWTWNSGFQVMARIDDQTKIWYGAMKIPWAALDGTPPSAGKTLRINFFRGQGPRSNRKEIAWQPTMSETFHVPERFGVLQLVAHR